MTSLEADPLWPFAGTAHIAHNPPFPTAHGARRSSTPPPSGDRLSIRLVHGLGPFFVPWLLYSRRRGEVAETAVTEKAGPRPTY